MQHPKSDLGCALVLQVDMEERFCSKVKELGCTCITISHRPALVAFHDLVLALDGEGGWSIHEGATGSFTEEATSEDGVANGNGAMQRSGGQGSADKARTKDAAAVLQGMRVRPAPSRSFWLICCAMYVRVTLFLPIAMVQTWSQYHEA